MVFIKTPDAEQGNFYRRGIRLKLYERGNGVKDQYSDQSDKLGNHGVYIQKVGCGKKWKAAMKL